MNQEKKSIILAGSLGSSLALSFFPLYYVGKELHRVGLFSDKIGHLKLMQNLFKDPLFSACFAIISVSTITSIASLVFLLKLQAYRNVILTPASGTVANNQSILASQAVPSSPGKQPKENNIPFAEHNAIIDKEADKEALPKDSKALLNEEVTTSAEIITPVSTSTSSVAGSTLTLPLALNNANASVTIEQQVAPNIHSLASVNSSGASSAKNSSAPPPPPMPSGSLFSKRSLTVKNSANKIDPQQKAVEAVAALASPQKVENPFASDIIEGALAKLKPINNEDSLKTNSETAVTANKTRLASNNASSTSSRRKFNIKAAPLSARNLEVKNFNMELADKLTARKNKTEGIIVNMEEVSKSGHNEASFGIAQSFNKTSSSALNDDIEVRNKVGGSEVSVKASEAALEETPLNTVESVNKLTASSPDINNNIEVGNNLAAKTAPPAPPAMPIGPLSASSDPSKKQIAEEIGIENNGIRLRHRNISGSKAARPLSNIIEEGVAQHRNPSTGTLNFQGLLKPPKDIKLTAEEEQKKRQKLDKSPGSKLAHIKSKEDITQQFMDKLKHRNSQIASSDTEIDEETDTSWSDSETEGKNKSEVQKSTRTSIHKKEIGARRRNLAAPSEPLNIAATVSDTNNESEITQLVKQADLGTQSASMQATLKCGSLDASRNWAEIQTPKSPPPSRGAGKTAVILLPVSAQSTSLQEDSALGQVNLMGAQSGLSNIANGNIENGTIETKPRPQLPAKPTTFSSRAVQPQAPHGQQASPMLPENLLTVATYKNNEEDEASKAKVKRGFWEGKAHKITKEAKKAKNALGLASSKHKDCSIEAPASSLLESNVSSLMQSKQK